MKKCLAFVLGGGGARGALQLGALRYLFECGYKPDLLVGTSIGAVNAAGLALWGVNLDGLTALEWAYQNVAEAHLMDPRLGRLLLRALSGQPNHHASRRVREYFIQAGITPDLRFEHITNVRLGLIGANLDHGQPVIYGLDPSQSILDGLMASIALPPWFAPVKQDGQYIVDGGAVSNLPVEPALTLGADEIIALDLNDPAFLSGNQRGINRYVEKLIYAVTQRQICLETALAEARGVPVRTLQLRSAPPVPMWDFSSYKQLIQTGYDIARRQVPTWHPSPAAPLPRPAAAVHPGLPAAH